MAKKTEVKIDSQSILRQALQKIELIQEAYRHVEDARYLVRNEVYNRNENTNVGLDLRSALIEMELDAWRNMFLMSLSLPEKLLKRIRMAAHDRFHGIGKNMSSWISTTGFGPSHWLDAAPEEIEETVAKWLKGENGNE